jgi:hypothetical protein
VRQKSVLRSSSLPGKLADCSSTNPEESGTFCFLSYVEFKLHGGNLSNINDSKAVIKDLFEFILLYNALLPHDATLFPWRCIWWNKASLRVTFFTWMTILGKILAVE